ncbi:MAG: NlpC/P60 family protein [Patescibacteria group bacterium]
MNAIKYSLAGCAFLAFLAIVTMALFATLTAGNQNNSAEPPPQVQNGQLDAANSGNDDTNGGENVPPSKQGYSDTCGNKIVAFAREQVSRGLTYVWGGCNVARGEFDCSGLVVASCNAAGLSGPRSADVQANPKAWGGGSGGAYWVIGPIGIEPQPLITNGRCPTGSDYRNLGPKKFDQNKLKPGDLLFYGDKDPTKDGTKYQGCNGIRHVAIYSGEGKMIQAPSSGRKLEEVGVRVSGFYGALRVCNDGGGSPNSTLDDFKVDQTKMFSGAKLEQYKRKITTLAKRRYNLNTWQLTPRWIVIHTTETPGFPNSFLSAHTGIIKNEDPEPPGAVSNYVLDGETVFQLLPDNVMSRSAFGMNNNTVNLEIVGYAASTLPDKTVHKAAQWALYISKNLGVPINNVISHEQINDASYKRGRADLVADYTDKEPYGGPNSSFKKVRTDPGRANMQRILDEINRLKGQ